MNANGTNSAVLVKRLRVAVRRPLHEHRARAVIERGDIAPPALPASAILCIRRVGLVAPPAWQAAARDAIANLAARAARPSRGFVPASADAVLFADRAELLAALARDWCGGRVHACWWWRALFRTDDEAAAVIAEWCETPEVVPAALHLAAAWNVVVPFVSRLPDRIADELTARVAAVFGVAIQPAVFNVVTGEPQRATSHSAMVPNDSARNGSCARSRSGDRPLQRAAFAAQAKWAREVASATLTAAQRRFAYTALVLQRAPASRRAELLSAALLDEVVGVSARSSRPVHAADSDATKRKQPLAASDNTPSPPPPVDRRSTQHEHAGSSIDDVAVNSGDTNAVEPNGLATVNDAPRDQLQARSVETAFGGVFYLINVAIAIGLYGDFTMPADRGLPLSPWHCLLLLARRLALRDAVDGDPIASLLAELAAGDQSRGADLLQPGWYDEWADWLAPFVIRRLAAALGVEPSQAGGLVVRRRARVRITPAHVDVVFALDELPIEIRCAGLDRNPGFVPAAGRTVTFIYV